VSKTKTYRTSRIDERVCCSQDSGLLSGQNESMHNMAAELHGNAYGLKQKQSVCIREVEFRITHQITRVNHGNVQKSYF
jgi:hypothetical protein